jgi:eukaryotic translation initiation factor 2-alpha kinase 4
MSHPHLVRYQTSWVETETQSVDARQRLGALKEATPEAHDPGGGDVRSNGSEEDGEVDSDVAAALDLEAFDFDLDEELDFLSGPHRSKNASYPSIHFGHGTDSVSRAPASNQVSHGGADISHETSESESHSVRTLYIQMEYIQGFTLREVCLRRCGPHATWT